MYESIIYTNDTIIWPQNVLSLSDRVGLTLRITLLRHQPPWTNQFTTKPKGKNQTHFLYLITDTLQEVLECTNYKQLELVPKVLHNSTSKLIWTDVKSFSSSWLLDEYFWVFVVWATYTWSCTVQAVRYSLYRVLNGQTADEFLVSKWYFLRLHLNSAQYR